MSKLIRLDPTQLSVTELSEALERAVLAGHDVCIAKVEPSEATQNCVYPPLRSKKYRRPAGRDLTSRQIVEMLQASEARERPWWKRALAWLVWTQ